MKKLYDLATDFPDEVEDVSPEVLKQFTSRIKEVTPKGDGKAVFLGEGSSEDFVDQERKDSGLAGWYRRIKNL